MNSTNRGALPRAPRAGLVLIGFLAVVSCGGGDSGTPPSCAVTSVVIQPSQISLGVSQSGTLDATVTATDCSTPPAVTWSSKNPGAVSVSAAGPQAQVTAVSFVQTGVLIIATAGGKVDTATVTVLTAPGPTITLSASSLVFTAVQVGIGPPSQSVTITYNGGGTFSDLSIGRVAYGPGASGWLYAPILTPTTISSADVIVLVSDVGLPPGTYTATIPILSAVASNSPQNLSVTLTITAGGVCSSIGAPIISVGQTIADSLVTTDCLLATGANADVYLLALASQTDVVIDMVTTAFTSRLTLYDAGTGVVIATAFPRLAQQSTRLTRRLSPGTYLIQGIGSAPGAYQMAVSTAPVPIPNDGSWVGTGSDGKAVSFTVQLDTVITFMIELGPLGSAGSSCSIVRLNTWTFNDGMIPGGTFSFPFMPGVGVLTVISGSIASSTSATGDYTDLAFTNIRPCGPAPNPSFTGLRPGLQWTAARK